MCKAHRYILRRAANPGRRRPASFALGERRRSSQSLATEIDMLAAALHELAAIRSTAEEAAGNILASAENLLASSESGACEKSGDAVMDIMTACSFHDLVGQRTARITDTIDKIIALRLKRAERTGKKGGAQRQKCKSGMPLNGPALPGSGPGQARIDALFAEA
jgi:chemotaxis regulatin CheY-phosphate phosphatase CheZ